jgi:hypothetical protein
MPRKVANILINITVRNGVRGVQYSPKPIEKYSMYRGERGGVERGER